MPKKNTGPTVEILARELQARGAELQACREALARERAAVAEQQQLVEGAAGLRNELDITRQQLEAAREQVARFEAELHAVLTSRTWRWSEPTRAAVRLLLGI